MPPAPVMFRTVEAREVPELAPDELTVYALGGWKALDPYMRGKGRYRVVCPSCKGTGVFTAWDAPNQCHLHAACDFCVSGVAIFLDGLGR